MNSQGLPQIHLAHQALLSAPLNLRVVTTEQAAAAHLRAQVFHASAEYDGQFAQLTFSSGTRPAHPDWGLTLETRYGPLDWCTPAAFCQTFGGIAPDSGPPHARLALCQAALALFPVTLRRLLGEPVVGAVWQTEPPSTSDTPLWLQLDCRFHDMTLTGRLAAGTRCWQTLLAAHWHAAPAMSLTRLAALPLTLPVIAGELELTAAESRTLGCGDVVPLSRCCFEIDGSGWVDLPACRLAIYWQAERQNFIVSHFETRTTMQPDYDDDDIDAYDELDEHEAESDMQDVDGTPKSADTGAPHAHSPNIAEPPAITLEQLPFRLKVVLGDFELSLHTLRNLAPGAVLELKQGLPPAVTLEVQGRCMGRGELVTLNGTLAVQLISWLDTPSGLPS